jgi:hypothetical protein
MRAQGRCGQRDTSASSHVAAVVCGFAVPGGRKTSIATLTAWLYSLGNISPIGDTLDIAVLHGRPVYRRLCGEAGPARESHRHKTSYRILEPFVLPGLGMAGPVEIQRAAKRIADFVGLGSKTFLIAPTRLNQTTGGRIELGSPSSDVFIELSLDLFDFPDAILATLSHEISHEFLEVNHISWGHDLADHYHNEILTDITAGFLGLGKLLINGHHCLRVTQDRVTQTQTVGYLDGGQLAFVYLMACHMRGVAPAEFEAGLNATGRRLLADCSARYGQYFQSRFRDSSTVDAIRAQITLLLGDVEGRVERYLTALRNLRQELESSETETLQKCKGPTDAVRSALCKLSSGEVDPCLRYISALRHDQLYDAERPVLRATSSEIEGATAFINKARHSLATRKRQERSWLRRVARVFKVSN